jgi:hypothetical protein
MTPKVPKLTCLVNHNTISIKISLDTSTLTHQYALSPRTAQFLHIRSQWDVSRYEHNSIQWMSMKSVNKLPNVCC